jgi:general secretion pathway protein D
MTTLLNMKQISFALIAVLSLNACTSTQVDNQKTPKSYLQQEQVALSEATLSATKTDELNKSQDKGISYLTPLSTAQNKQKKQVDLTQQFSDEKLVKMSADDLALKDYLHYVMGDLLKVSYILGEQVKSDNQSVTLNLQQDISQRKLFNVSEKLLTERGYIIRLEDGIYYVHKIEGSANQGSIVYGYGKELKNVPDTSSTIVQLVPFTFGMQTSLANTLRQIVNIKATPDFQRNTIILEGKRKDVIRALEFINLMDQPAFKNRQIGVYKANFVSTEELVEKLPALLKQEGISVSAKGQNDLAVSIVALDRIATIVLFANSKALIERAGFWAKQIDQAPSGNELQYFIYKPQFALASDLGQSLSLLISGTSGSAGSAVSTSTSASGQNSSKNNSANKSKSSPSLNASNEDMSLVIDERANALIFSTTGDKYRQLLPLIKRLDVMPKQVILEMMIAEVKLTDEFKQGVEFALTNKGAAITGGFDLTSGSGGLSYLLTGTQGSLSYSLLQTNTNVNVLSRPSLLVRDGVQANITVGDDIPTVGDIVTDPVNGSRTSVVYRKTGVELQVTPTINARGIITMVIQQKISNQAPGDDSVAGSPIIFERSISTEVVAGNGQTVILGGLISENRTVSDRSVPFFSSLPFIGKLFDSTSDSKDKTELVVLVTPRIIESPAEWDEIMNKFLSSYNNVKIDY